MQGGQQGNPAARGFQQPQMGGSSLNQIGQSAYDAGNSPGGMGNPASRGFQQGMTPVGSGGKGGGSPQPVGLSGGYGPMQQSTAQGMNPGLAAYAQSNPQTGGNDVFGSSMNYPTMNGISRTGGADQFGFGSMQPPTMNPTPQPMGVQGLGQTNALAPNDYGMRTAFNPATGRMEYVGGAVQGGNGTWTDQYMAGNGPTGNVNGVNYIRGQVLPGEGLAQGNGGNSSFALNNLLRMYGGILGR